MNHKSDLNASPPSQPITIISKQGENPMKLLTHSFGVYNVFVINIKRREDRKISIENQLKKMGIDFKIYYGWDSKLIGEEITNQEIDYFYDKPFYSWLKTENIILGRKGCMLSHLKILRYALKKGLKNIMVIEDDAIFINHYLPPIPNNALLLYLGGKIQGKKPITNRDWILIDSFKLWELTAYIIPTNYNIHRIYSELVRKGLCPRVIDGMYCSRIQKKYPCYLLNKEIVKQNRSFDSDVTFINK